MIYIECDSCSHIVEMLDLFEASQVMGLHPESVRRKYRYGQVGGTKIERGVYFQKPDLIPDETLGNFEWLGKFEKVPTPTDEEQTTITGGE